MWTGTPSSTFLIQAGSILALNLKNARGALFLADSEKDGGKLS
jgi:hypothetical protein